jgi:hypothetical protein
MYVAQNGKNLIIMAVATFDYCNRLGTEIMAGHYHGDLAKCLVRTLFSYVYVEGFNILKL